MLVKPIVTELLPQVTHGPQDVTANNTINTTFTWSSRDGYSRALMSVLRDWGSSEGAGKGRVFCHCLSVSLRLCLPHHQDAFTVLFLKAEIRPKTRKISLLFSVNFNILRFSLFVFFVCLSFLKPFSMAIFQSTSFSFLFTYVCVCVMKTITEDLWYSVRNSTVQLFF